MQSLQAEIERLASAEKLGADARQIFLQFRDQLTRGEIRAAEKSGGEWKINVWGAGADGKRRMPELR